ncbi:MAG TPA: hypothetical protein VF338_01575 [Leptolinea sp.]
MTKSFLKNLIRGIKYFILWFFCSLVISGSILLSADYPEKVRQYTHTIEFDYVEWTLQAMWMKIEQASLRVEEYLPASRPPEIVREYLKADSQISQLKSQIAIIYADPQVTDKASAVLPLHSQLDKYEAYKSRLAPYAESTLQQQISEVLAADQLTILGQPIPPVLYHSTPLPMALIVSPRERIQQDANISLLTEMTAGDMTTLEDQVMTNLDVSALVVPVGGVGIYPTMVMATSDLPYLAETIAHEWTHNFLTLRPLGLNYETNSSLRTINETVASIAGNEIGEQVLRKYYPELIPPDVEPARESSSTTAPALIVPDPFNYRQEMHTTRVQVDELLAKGKISDAENYMEQRRNLFWQNGYPIRRLNQAYFAFYGAYADTPGGASGKDPVGPVVRAFRQQSPSLVEFLEKISMVTSFDQLKGMVRQLPEN